MAPTTQRPSIRDRIRPIETGDPVLAVHFIGDDAVFVLVSGEVVVAGDGERRLTLHDGATPQFGPVPALGQHTAAVKAEFGG